ncbi:helix-turn-helix domain-containing protein [Liquorilactobacillus ghanensis]|uniref:helix-turn-helix domain-containing protein n=1 Tax=Liquorilactobacillus ghanensis TaxID=399370 RepID=UPI0039ECE094
MMSSGEIVKQIRLSKGLKAKYVYKDLMTQSTSSRYERGKEEIKIAKLWLLLHV